MRRVVGILLLTLGLCGWPLIVQAATAGEGFTDNFNDNARNTTVWNINSLEGSAVDPLVTVVETSGQLQVTPRASQTGSHYNGYSTVDTYDLTGGFAAVEVVQVAGVATSANTSLMLVLDGANWYGITQENGNLFFQALVDGVMSETFIPYVNATHRWWRIRHDSTPNQMVYETSTDGSSWTERRRIASTVAVTTLSLEVSAGTYTSVATPGVAIFDNVTLSLTTTSLTCTAPTSGAPYTVSTFACVDLVTATIEHHGCAGASGANCTGWSFAPSQADQWVMTWASDNNVYGMWADGRGWNGAIADGAIGLTRITDDPPSMAATDVYSNGTRTPSQNYKPQGLIGDASAVMRGYYTVESDGWDGSFAMNSSNNGTSWTFTGTKLFSGSTDGVTVVGVAQSGAGYTGTLPAGVDDSYYYVYLSRQRDFPTIGGITQIYLARVPKASWNVKASYQYISAIDGANVPTWTSTFASKIPIFSDANGMEYHVGVSYNPAWGRWLLAKHFFTSGCTGGGNTRGCRLGLFEGLTPWGPWKTLYYGAFLDNFWKFTAQMPQKWMAGDGTSFWLSWSGWPEYDNVNFVRFDVTLATVPDDVPPAAPTNLRVVGP